MIRETSESFKLVSRKPIKVSQEELIRLSYFDSDDLFPLIIEPNIEDLNLLLWTQNNLDFIDSRLLRHGAILFRNFPATSVSQFEKFTRTISPELMNYNERAAPRTEIKDQIYTSTEYPATHEIYLHHEMSYSHNWPTKIWFFCLQPAAQGGNTPIASDRKVFPLLDPKIVNRFLEKKIMYVRNYGEGVDLTWQEVFQTEDRSLVEDYCRRTHMQFEWRSGDRLRTRRVRPPVVTHPRTGETVWFNHAHMFHVSSLEPAVRDSLLEEFKDDELPRNAFYGDGTPIEASVLEEIRQTYRQAAISFPWQQGDILMLDNFLVSHGRDSFVGPRTILVAMAELFSAEA